MRLLSKFRLSLPPGQFLNTGRRAGENNSNMLLVAAETSLSRGC